MIEVFETMAVRIFISSVSDEFRNYRDQLRHDLTRHDVEVKIQEDFKDYGGVTLDKLDLYISTCDAVVHLIGDMTGAYAKGASTDAIYEKHPDLLRRFRPLAACFAAGTDLSYTQWEAWLALYHRKTLLIAKADDRAERGSRCKPTAASRAAQKAHLERLAQLEHYPGFTFTSPDNLAKQIVCTAVLDLLVQQRSTDSVERSRDAGNPSAHRSSSGWAEFVRKTYDGVPLKWPDERFQPLCVFAAHQGRPRYLGTLMELAVTAGWKAPHASNNDLELSAVSPRLVWDTATDLVGALLSGVLDINVVPVMAGLKAAETASQGVRIKLGRVRRAAINPFALARSIGSDTHQIPANLMGLASHGAPVVYLTDAVMYMRELTLDFDGDRAAEAAAKLEAELQEQGHTERMIRTKSRLLVTGTRRTPFAFTCLRIECDRKGFIAKMTLESPDVGMQAVPVGLLASVKHEDIGSPDGLVAFDD